MSYFKNILLFECQPPPLKHSCIRPCTHTNSSSSLHWCSLTNTSLSYVMCYTTQRGASPSNGRDLVMGVCAIIMTHWPVSCLKYIITVHFMTCWSWNQFLMKRTCQSKIVMSVYSRPRSIYAISISFLKAWI